MFNKHYWLSKGKSVHAYFPINMNKFIQCILQIRLFSFRVFSYVLFSLRLCGGKFNKYSPIRLSLLGLLYDPFIFITHYMYYRYCSLKGQQREMVFCTIPLTVYKTENKDFIFIRFWFKLNVRGPFFIHFSQLSVFSLYAK